MTTPTGTPATTNITHVQAFIAQLALSLIFAIGYFGIIVLMMLGFMKMPADARDAFMALLGVLTAGMGTIIGYWFSRQRASEPAPPSE